METFSGSVIDGVVWGGSDSVGDVMVGVANIVAREVGMSLRVEGFFTGLSELLEVASTAPERRPIVQLSPPLWAVTTRGIVTYGRRQGPYALTLEQLRGQRIGQDMAGKSWSDPDSFDLAQAVALGLFPPADPDEPPF